MKKLLLPILALVFGSAFAGNLGVENKCRYDAKVMFELPGGKKADMIVPANGYRELKGIEKIDKTTVEIDKPCKNGKMKKMRSIRERDIKFKKGNRILTIDEDDNAIKPLKTRKHKGHLAQKQPKKQLKKQLKKQAKKQPKCERRWWQFWAPKCPVKK